MEKIKIRIKNAMLPLAGCLLMLGACSDGDNGAPAGDDVVAVERVNLSIGETQSSLGASTRAVSGFVVNTANDPIYSFDQKLGWTLEMSIHKGTGVYAEGSGTFTYTDPYWTTTADIYMPNYRLQNVEAVLYPASWKTGGETIASDQTAEATFIEQDILEQDGDPTYETVPAHYLEVKMRHSHSMIDFVLAEVDINDITNVTVVADGITYQPYKVAAVTDREEYMVILPVGTQYPVIKVDTKAGAHYSKELDLDATKVNTCYYVRLVGLELVLEGLTVSNWAYGEAAAGDYSSVTSYPTFRGPVDMTVTVYYSSDTSQEMTFNEKGEAVEQPAGRTIVAIASGGLYYVLQKPYTIRTQIIDLNPYIAQIGN